MVMNEENISPEERLLKVIKGEPLPVPPRINPFTAPRAGTVLPPLSSVLEYIVNTPATPPDPANIPAAPASSVKAVPVAAGKPVEVSMFQPIIPSANPAPAAPATVNAQARPVSRVPLPEAKAAPVVSRPAPAAVPAAAPVTPKAVPVVAKVEDVKKPVPAEKVEPKPVAPPPAVVAPAVQQTVKAESKVPLQTAQRPGQGASRPAAGVIVGSEIKAPATQGGREPGIGDAPLSKPAIPAPAVAKQPEPVAKKAEPKPEPKAEVKPAPKEVQKDSPKPVVAAEKPKAVPVAAEKPKVAPAAAEKPKAVPVAPAEEKPKLKVAKADVPAGGDARKPAEDKIKEKPVQVPESPRPVASLTLAVAKKQGEKKALGIRNVNFGLAAAALLLIAFSVTEIFAKMRTDDSLRKSAVGPAGGLPGQGPVATAAGYQLPSLDIIIQNMGERPVLSAPGQREQKLPGGADAAPGPQLMDWMKYVQENIKLMGFSGNPAGGAQEVIVQEGKDKDAKINFFKAGQKIQIQGKDILVENIKDDQMFLTDGKRRMTVK